MASPNQSRSNNSSRRRRFNHLQHSPQDRPTSTAISQPSHAPQHREGASIMSGSQHSYSFQRLEEQSNEAIMSRPQPSYSRQGGEEPRDHAIVFGTQPHHPRQLNGSSVSGSHPPHLSQGYGASSQSRHLKQNREEPAHSSFSPVALPSHSNERQMIAPGQVISEEDTSNPRQQYQERFHDQARHSRPRPLDLSQLPRPLPLRLIDGDISFEAQTANRPQEQPRSYALSGSQPANLTQEQPRNYILFGSQPANLPQDQPRSYVLSGSQTTNMPQERPRGYILSGAHTANLPQEQSHSYILSGSQPANLPQEQARGYILSGSQPANLLQERPRSYILSGSQSANLPQEQPRSYTLSGSQLATLPQEQAHSYILSGSQPVNVHQEQRNAYTMSESQVTTQRQQNQALRDRNMSRRQALDPIQPSWDQVEGHNLSAFHPVNPRQHQGEVLEPNLSGSLPPNRNHQLRGQVDGRNLPGSQSANHNGRHPEEPRENNSFASHPPGPGQQHEEPEPTGTEGPNLIEGVPFEHMPAAVRHLEASLRNGTYNDIGDGPFQNEDVANQTRRFPDDGRQSSEVEERRSSGLQRSNSNRQGQGRRQHRSRGDRSATTPPADPRPMEIEETQMFDDILRQAVRDIVLAHRVLQVVLSNLADYAPDLFTPQGQGADGERDTPPDDDGSETEAQEDDSEFDRALEASAFSNAVDVSTDCFEYCNLSAPSTSFGRDCSICLVELQNGQIVRRLRCKHAFHRDCVDQWFVDSRSCPLCRLNVEGPPLY